MKLLFIAFSISIATSLRVIGNRLVDSSNNTVTLSGVNLPGSELNCVLGTGIFSKNLPSAEELSENYNAVRIPLNEHCWLGINKVAIGGETYRAEVERVVDSMIDEGLIVVLDLLWSLKGTAEARFQEPLANKDHSITFWDSVARRFDGK